MEDLLPVSLLCGFLGAGKTTLMKHVLETKHSQEASFRCAVIVNDMAALNIDKSLIDSSALVQNDEVVAMQNGCLCCTLQDDLVEQIKQLAGKKIFDYMLIEASGVSEPSQIAPLFELYEDDHDHEAEPDAVQLGEVARLDTCVTVVDAAQFHANLNSVKAGGEAVHGTLTELLVEQIEFSNVVVLNKSDLVTEEQLSDIRDQVSLLNPRAKCLSSLHSKINVVEMLDTKLFSQEMMDDVVVLAATRAEANGAEEEDKSCCKESLAAGKSKCCDVKAGQVLDSGVSQILMEPNAKTTRHEARFGITSFVYRARRPFHPGRLWHDFLEPFMVVHTQEDGEEGEPTAAEAITAKQDAAAKKQRFRQQTLGDLLRSKGFLWIATSHGVMGSWSHAGNMVGFEAEVPFHQKSFLNLVKSVDL